MQYIKTVDKISNTAILQVSAMIIQPFVPYVNYQGIMSRGGSGENSMHFGIQEGKLRCVIVNNGIGREGATETRVDLILSKITEFE